ncbi:MAG: hypothetical protein QM535_06565 [Limnohabitans sp.]|nr:hypothetical protein [Limnohabitans sp.]
MNKQTPCPPLELFMADVLLDKTTEYCCTIKLVDTQQEIHYHWELTHLEIEEDYKIIHFNKGETYYTNFEQPTNVLENIKQKLFPIVAKVGHCGSILEILNYQEIQDRHYEYYSELYSPLLPSEIIEQLNIYYDDYSTPEAIIQLLQDDSALQLFLFPLYGTFHETHKFFRNEITNEQGEVKQWTFDAKLLEALNDDGNIQIELTGIYNNSPSFFHNTTHSFCYHTHELLSIKGEMTNTDDETVHYEFIKFIDENNDIVE